MIKTGIYTLEQAGDSARHKGLFGGERKISVTLYPDAVALENGGAIAEKILYQFSDERGAFKRTYAKRFPEFDPAVIAIIKNHFSSSDILAVHDVAVSDGRTAADFFQALSAQFPKLEFMASDYNPKLTVLEKGNTKVTIGHTGQILEICQPPFVFNLIHRDSYKFYPLNHIIKCFVKAAYASPLVKAWKQGKAKAREFYLFSPDVLALAQSDSRFTLTQHNLLEEFEHPYHVIRAMNILNPAYFTAAEYKRLLSYIHKGLHEGGLLITGSNEEAGSLVHGGIYRKTIRGFEKIWQSGDGSFAEQAIFSIDI